MLMSLPTYLDTLGQAAQDATGAEEAFRRSIAGRTKALERERVFAFRRLNLMRAVAAAVAEADSEPVAVAVAAATLRVRLGWSSDSDARTEVLSRFATVAQAMASHLAPDEAEAEPRDVGAALAEFETWYEATHPGPFWMLFENVMPETPVVDF